MAILRQHLEEAEQDLDNCELEEYADLRKALLEVSSTISQIKHTLNVFAEKQRNFKNTIRTLKEENICLNEALFRERAKRLHIMDQSPTTMVSGGIGMQSSPPGASYVCGAFDNHAASITFASMFNYSIAATSGPSGGVKRGCQIPPVFQNTDIKGSELRPSSAKRGRLCSGAAASSMPSVRIMTEKNPSASSASAASAMVPALQLPRHPVPARPSTQPTQAPLKVGDVNDIEQMAEAVKMRKNRHSWYDLLNMEELRQIYE